MRTRITLEPGMYLSDGEKLVQVRRVYPDHVMVEHHDVSGKAVGTLEASEIDEKWWIVRPEKDDEALSIEVQQWLEQTYPELERQVKQERERHLRERCGCARCQQANENDKAA